MLKFSWNTDGIKLYVWHRDFSLIDNRLIGHWAPSMCRSFWPFFPDSNFTLSPLLFVDFHFSHSHSSLSKLFEESCRSDLLVKVVARVQEFFLARVDSVVDRFHGFRSDGACTAIDGAVLTGGAHTAVSCSRRWSADHTNPRWRDARSWGHDAGSWGRVFARASTHLWVGWSASCLWFCHLVVEVESSCGWGLLADGG